jgi:hypothetical protein
MRSTSGCRGPYLARDTESLVARFRELKEHSPAASDEEAEMATASRWLEWLRLYALDHVIASLWDGMLRACGAVEVFDFFHSAPLATDSYRHHCLLALRRKSCVRRIPLRPSIA